jgi:hypothetical protein
VEVDGGSSPPSFHGHLGSAYKAQWSGSLLAALLARSRGQSALLAQPRAASSSFQAPAQD